MAPNLCDIIRKILERKQAEPEAIKIYLEQLGSLQRYNNAFQALWSLIVTRGKNPLEISQEEISHYILILNKEAPAQARHAYSACLLIPGLENLRFSPMLKKLKQSWNISNEKYACFWDVSSLIKRLLDENLNWNNIAKVRERLILCWRLFALHRSVDLSRIKRVLSWVNGKPFVQVRRKGWKTYKWEEVIQLPVREISPWHLLSHYVALTASQVAAQPSAKPKDELDNNTVLIALNAPYRALSSDRVGSITKEVLAKYGIPPHWGPHSTRGAGVSFYKHLGLSSEQVCEIGRWKNTEAFKHCRRVKYGLTGNRSGARPVPEAGTWERMSLPSQPGNVRGKWCSRLCGVQSRERQPCHSRARGLTTPAKRQH